MRNDQLEYWVLQIADRALAGQPIEDDRVELKTNWPDVHKAARRLGAHCNSCGSDSVLWLIGIDERSRAIPGATNTESSTWLSQLRSHFHELAPELLAHLVIACHNATVVALLFSTTRRPYLVINPRFGNQAGDSIEFEVPWRDGTRVRTARRGDLLRLLVPASQAPTVEPLKATFRHLLNRQNPTTGHHFKNDSQIRVSIYLYVTVPGVSRLVFPFHKMVAEFSLERPSDRLVGNFREVGPLRAKYTYGDQPVFPHDDRLSRTIDSTATELLIDGPGVVILRTDFEMQNDVPLNVTDETFVTFSLSARDACDTCVMTARGRLALSIEHD